ncbi:MATE family efflux transporter [Aestuariicella sp. G3-2]|uniref:MATE family efflux transporter n=1 Tax=Pseudomaricurvus albidus TaxID=2842452 RepID=UPI001C0B0FA8|nr:MATE family efflux transporter [Aestuariicella albida]MBU3071206.1 MATE family efflux transporter [Aestuariicella albida]
MLSFIRTDKQTLKLLIAIALPMIISQGTFAAMIFTDRFFMSLIGPTHVAASLGGGVAAFMCMSLWIGLLSYGNALVAQFLGAGQKALCSKVVTQGLLITALCTPLLWLMGYGVYVGFDALGHDPVQLVLEKQYFKILLACGFLALIKTCFSSFFAGIGNTRVVMVVDVLGVFLNIPLSYGLIFGVWGLPELGIAGAAWGTVLSNLIAMVLFFAFYRAAKNNREYSVAGSFVFDKTLFKRYWRLGFPSGLELFLNVAAFNAFILLFQSYGVAAGASAAIVLNWDLLSFVPMVGLNIAVISLVGRCIGAQDHQRLNSVISSGFLLGLTYSGTLALLFIVFREQLVGVFITSATDGEAINQLASWMMIGMASYVMADAVILVSGGVLRGAGDTRWLMVTSVLLHWLMVVAQYVVIIVLELGPKTAWMVFVGLILALALSFTLRLTSPAWRRHFPQEWATNEPVST